MMRGTARLLSACVLIFGACDGTITAFPPTTGLPIPDDGDDDDDEGGDDTSYNLGDMDSYYGDVKEPPDVEPPVPWENPANPFGIGLVGAGNTLDWDRTVELTGAGGHIKLIFAGVSPGMTSAPQEWIDAIHASYARDLVPVVRIGPGWGQMNIRDHSDDAEHLD
jgi:hypothetical protein